MPDRFKRFIGLIILIAIGWLFFYSLTKTEEVILEQGLHYSYFSQKEFFDKAYEFVKSKTYDNPGGVFVNHHLLAPNLIAEGLAAVTTDKMITVVLISPNHFSRGRGSFTTTSFDWQTPYGVLESDKDILGELLENEVITLDTLPFEQEHGVSAIVPFIKKSLPNAKIIPILVKEYASAEDLDKLVNQLHRSLPKDALVVGSFDFSHYLTDNAADFTDYKNLAVINNFDYEGLDFMDVDSKKGLELMLKLMEKRGYQKFNLIEHTNSGKITKDPDLTETTSYIIGTFTKGEKTKDESVTLLFFGTWQESDKQSLNQFSKNYSFEKLDRLFMGSDLTSGIVSDPDLSGLLAKLGYKIVIGPDFKIQARTVRGKNIIITKTSDRIFINDPTSFVSFLTDNKEAIEIAGSTVVLRNLGNHTLENKDKTVFAVGIAFLPERAEYFLFPITFAEGSWQLLSAEKSAMILETIANSSLASDEIKNQIKLGRFTIKK